jgi:collagen type IV alpha
MNIFESILESINFKTLNIIRHSQKTTVPDCPLDTVRLWTGYSLLNLHGNARASGQELGSTGSCMQRFSTMPVVRCDYNDKCQYAQDQDNSYWLSTSEPMTPSMRPVDGDRIKDFISRCSVCESTGNVRTLKEI